MSTRKNKYEPHTKESIQKIRENTSKAMIEKRKEKNLLLTTRDLVEKAEILPMLVENIKEEVANGINKNALELFKLIKENEKQEVDIKSANIGVQKVYVTKEQEKEVLNHIKEVIE